MDSFIRITRNNIAATPQFEEKQGPTDNESFCLISNTKNTIPHKVRFNSIDAGNDKRYISLVGGNQTIETNVYGSIEGNTTIDSISQYFLEHGNTNEIQYIYHQFKDEEHDIMDYQIIIPGLLYDKDNGTVLGYMKTLVANNGNITIEVPKNRVATYTLSNLGSGVNYTRTGNVITITGIANNIDGAIISTTIDDETNSCAFDIYVSSSNTRTFTVKPITCFAEYVIASQITDNKITSIVNALHDTTSTYINDEIGFVNNISKLFPTFFLATAVETMPNITPAFYKVPAALVPNENGVRELMVDVTGVSSLNFIEYTY